MRRNWPKIPLDHRIRKKKTYPEKKTCSIPNTTITEKKTLILFRKEKQFGAFAYTFGSRMDTVRFLDRYT